MGDAMIPLAKGLNIGKLEFPVYVSEKLDGVPVRFIISKRDWGIQAEAVTRQGEPAYSCKDDLIAFINNNHGKFLGGVTYNFVWEVTHVEHKNFKDISGVVRRKTPQSGLIYNLFDYDAHVAIESPLGVYFKSSGTGFDTRHICATEFYIDGLKFRTIPQMRYEDADTLQDMLDNTETGPDQEGWIIRSHNAPFKPGKRHWDYQKVVKEPTIDLQIVAYEEGKGKNAGAVGRLIASYNGKLIGVGPGKLSYAERKELWTEYLLRGDLGQVNKIAEIKYKPDEGYDALRQPTFQCWREDKLRPDA